jgi:hypothetical protein
MANCFEQVHLQLGVHNAHLWCCSPECAHHHSLQEGRQPAMQRLFDTGMASPFDQSEYGERLWEVSLVRGDDLDSL